MATDLTTVRVDLLFSSDCMLASRLVGLRIIGGQMAAKT